jgi:hypothetical protein
MNASRAQARCLRVQKFIAGIGGREIHTHDLTQMLRAATKGQGIQGTDLDRAEALGETHAG